MSEKLTREDILKELQSVFHLNKHIHTIMIIEKLKI